ncbi:cytochrome P450 [Mycolicibacterium sphagni]|uniref:cytochrome P450 n=1 Tax=Mycolicibacterium sphagni TaxID=1786 RepID=UPI0021F3A0A4|nr:cytochrome P450 [Mycolicibacterium sphagni]MCV7177050.1 cytochrome P450 [Mycolicibacterium sphagni]
MLKTSCPALDIDPWTQDNLIDPYPGWSLMRDAGPVVYLSRYDIYALPRYSPVRSALSNWQDFSSANGALLTEEMNQATAGMTLHTDPPEHQQLRGVLRRPLTHDGIEELEDDLRTQAETLVELLIRKGTFEGVNELAEYLPMAVVSRQVGLPEEGRTNMLAWSDATGDTGGPMNDRFHAALPMIQEALAYSYDPTLPSRLKPGGWAQRLWDAAEVGDLPLSKCPTMLMDYWGPALGTTVAAISWTVWQFSRHPDQWTQIRRNPALLPNAILESVRLESPLAHLSRTATRDLEIDGIMIPAGSRVLMMFGSANRDDRKFDEPERFDIHRRTIGHMGFGFGEHTCIGQSLARLQMKLLFGALLERVTRFEVNDFTPAVNNMLHGVERMQVTLHTH